MNISRTKALEVLRERLKTTQEKEKVELQKYKEAKERRVPATLAVAQEAQEALKGVVSKLKKGEMPTIDELNRVAIRAPYDYSRYEDGCSSYSAKITHIKREIALLELSSDENIKIDTRSYLAEALLNGD